MMLQIIRARSPSELGLLGALSEGGKRAAAGDLKACRGDSELLEGMEGFDCSISEGLLTRLGCTEEHTLGKEGKAIK